MNEKLPTFTLEEYNHLTGQAAETGFEAFSNYKENLSMRMNGHGTQQEKKKQVKNSHLTSLIGQERKLSQLNQKNKNIITWESTEDRSYFCTYE